MKRLVNLLCTVAIGLSVAMPFVSPAMAGEKETAICLVCQAKEGASPAEEVVAWRTYEGKRYGFCAEACAKEFDADPASFMPPELPRPAPEIGLTDLAGTPLRLASLRGKVVLLDFWATWCKPCAKTMPELQKLHDRHAASGFTVVGVSIDEGDARKKVAKFLSGKKVTYPNGIDAGRTRAWERYGVKAVPAAFLIDGKGRIVAQWTGAPDPEVIEAEVTRLLAGAKPD